MMNRLRVFSSLKYQYRLYPTYLHKKYTKLTTQMSLFSIHSFRHFVDRKTQHKLLITFFLSHRKQLDTTKPHRSYQAHSTNTMKITREAQNRLHWIVYIPKHNQAVKIHSIITIIVRQEVRMITIMEKQNPLPSHCQAK